MDMKLKKVFTGILSITMLLTSATTAFAASTGDFNIIKDVEIVNEEKQSYFKSFTGTVKEVSDSENIKGAKFVLVESENGEVANIIISKETYILDNATISKGEVITGFYNANAPMIMIYPAQYNSEIVIVNNKDYTVKADIFDENLVSYDNLLKLKISDKTEILSQDGAQFKGALANRKLLVIYDVAAQTNPIKIIVLSEKEKEQGTSIGNKADAINNKKMLWNIFNLIIKKHWLINNLD